VEWSTAVRALDGALIGLVVARLSWGLLVYPAIWRAAQRDGASAPRHLPGWPALAAFSSLAGAAANVGFASHLAAIPAAFASALAVGAYHDLPSRFRQRRAARAERRRLRRELAGTD
jgi:hypothetical protein